MEAKNLSKSWLADNAGLSVMVGALASTRASEIPGAARQASSDAHNERSPSVQTRQQHPAI